MIVMEEKTRNSGQGLGVAALILGIISFIVALIPCVGILAVFTAIVSVVLGAIGLSQANRNDSPKGLAIGGLILGVVALLVAVLWLAFFANVADRAPYFEEKFEDVIKDLEDEFEDGNFSITIQDGEDKIEINSSIKKELRDELYELEDLKDLDDQIKEDIEDTKVDIKIKIDSSSGEKKK